MLVLSAEVRPFAERKATTIVRAAPGAIPPRRRTKRSQSGAIRGPNPFSGNPADRTQFQGAIPRTEPIVTQARGPNPLSRKPADRTQARGPNPLSANSTGRTQAQRTIPPTGPKRWSLPPHDLHAVRNFFGPGRPSVALRGADPSGGWRPALRQRLRPRRGRQLKTWTLGGSCF